MSDISRMVKVTRDAVPTLAPDVIEWAEKNVVFPNSARAKHFSIGVSPWLREPLLRSVDKITRIVTLMKPVQSGGSSLGEVLMLYWIMFSRGFFQYNWNNDKRADERWASRVEGILKACPPVAKRMLEVGTKECEINFGNVFFRMQGVFSESNLDSDSIALQINEEIHSWEPGHLKKARNRSTAVWNPKSVDISNAGMVGDQLDGAFNEGTAQRWTVKCPGCGLFHTMRTIWEDHHPELGGLRYDASDAREGAFGYNYNKIRPTIRFQMPCGATVHNEDMRSRKQMSALGKYSEPTNANAELTHRSYTYESVCVDFIDWMTLIKDKHDALRSRRLGDLEPWRKYKCERECIPYDLNDVPVQGLIVLQKEKKNRDGLKPPKLRLFALDRQQGTLSKGEFPHWWLVIRDVSVVEGALVSLLVHEGKHGTDEEAIALVDAHGCQRWHGVADSGDDTTHVYTFCLKYGVNAIKGGNQSMYAHPGNVKRIFSVERPLHAMVNAPALYPYIKTKKGLVADPREPLFWEYSKQGIRERLHWLRKATIFRTPDDVSEDYKKHNEAEERVTRFNKNNPGEEIVEWIQQKTRNDLFVCECYVAMQIEQAGFVRDQPVSKQEKS